MIEVYKIVETYLCGHIDDESLKIFSHVDLSNILGIFDDFYSQELFLESVDVSEFVNVKLRIAEKLLRSSILDKRITGINEIVSCISNCGNLHGIDQVLSEWISHKRILGLIFENNLHISIVDRSLELIVYMMVKGIFTESDFQTILYPLLMSDQHRSLLQDLSEFISRIISKIPSDRPEIWRIFYDKLESIDITVFDENSLIIWNSLIHFTPGNLTELVYRGITNLWKICENIEPENSSLHSAAQRFIMDHLRRHDVHKFRKRFINLLIDSMKSSRPVYDSFVLFLQIVMNSENNIVESNELVDLLNERGYDVSFIEECKTYNEQLQENICDKNNLKALESDNIFKPKTSPSHFEQVEVRIEIFSRLSNLYYDANQKFLKNQKSWDLMWNLFVLKARNNEERSSVFAKLIHLNDLDILQYFFDTKVEHLSPKYIEKEVFDFIQMCFLKINLALNRIKFNETTHRFESCGENRHGEEILWKLMTQSTNSFVYARSSQILIDLYLGNSVSSGSMWIAFLKKCLALLSNFTVEESVQEVSNCLDSLMKFLCCFEVRFNSSLPNSICSHTFEDQTQKIKLYVSILGDKSRRALLISPHETILATRNRIVKLFGLRKAKCRLIANGRELNNNEKTLMEENISENCQLSIVTSSEEASESMEVVLEEDIQYPHYYLTKEANFRLIFSLLKFSEMIKGKVWPLIMKLPTFDRWLSEITQAISDPDTFDLYMDSFFEYSIYEQLYKLQILSNLLFIAEGENFSRSPKSFWKSCTNIDRLITIYDQLLANIKNLDKEFENSLISTFSWIIKNIISSELAVESTFICNVLTRVEELFQFLNESISFERKQCILNLKEVLFSVLMNKNLDCQKFFDSLVAHPNFMNLLKQISITRNLEQIYYYEDIQDIFLEDILSYLEYCMQNNFDQDAFLVIFQKLLEIIPEISKNPRDSGIYLKFSITCLEHVLVSKKFEEKDAQKLYCFLIDELKRAPIFESFSNLDCVDYYTSSLVSMMKKLLLNRFNQLQCNVEDLYDVLFKDYLFSLPLLPCNIYSNIPPRAKTDALRSLVFETLETLMQVSKYHAPMESYLLLPKNSWGDRDFCYDPAKLLRSPDDYVGLRNLGSTCYMNSILQQFFMIKPFRDKLLFARAKDNQKYLRLLEQLKLLFANLQESAKKSYDTVPFCLSYVDDDGNQMDVNNQMDVDEFFNGLFDKLENCLDQTEFESIFRDFFGGQLAQKIESKDCDHVSERTEKFFALQCEVKNQENLESSLQNYVQGEMLDGDNKYFCSQCSKHVNAVKRAALKKLPRHLMFHLKRFDFDFETMSRVKIDDYFEFPGQIDMQPYTDEFLSNKSIEKSDQVALSYKLSGVVIHSGTAESGHYYSFIRSRNKPTDDVGMGNWYHFNDSIVEPFNIEALSDQCFGSLPNQYKNFNAYILLYDKMESSIDTDTSVPTSIEAIQTVWKNNVEFISDKYLFDRYYLNYVAQTIPRRLENSDTIFFGQMCDFLHKVVIFSTDTSLQLSIYVDPMVDLIKKNKVYAKCYLENCLKLQFFFRKIFLECHVPVIRESIEKLILIALETVRLNNQEDVIFLEQKIVKETDFNGNFSDYLQLLQSLLGNFLSLFDEASYYWRNFSHFWSILRKLGDLGMIEKYIFIQKKTIPRLTYLLAEDIPPKEGKINSPDGSSHVDLTEPLRLLEELVKVCSIENNENSSLAFTLDRKYIDRLFALNEDGVPGLLLKLLEIECSNSYFLGRFICHLSALSENLLDSIVETIFASIDKYSGSCRSSYVSLALLMEKFPRIRNNLMIRCFKSLKTIDSIEESRDWVEFMTNQFENNENSALLILQNYEHILLGQLTNIYPAIRTGVEKMLEDFLLNEEPNSWNNFSAAAKIDISETLSAINPEEILLSLVNELIGMRKHVLLAADREKYNSSYGNYKYADLLRFLRKFILSKNLKFKLGELLEIFSNLFTVVAEYSALNDRDAHLLELLRYLKLCITLSEKSTLSILVQSTEFSNSLINLVLHVNLASEDQCLFNAELVPTYYWVLGKILAHDETLIPKVSQNNLILWSIEWFLLKGSLEFQTKYLRDSIIVTANQILPVLQLCAEKSPELKNEVVALLSNNPLNGGDTSDDFTNDEWYGNLLQIAYGESPSNPQRKLIEHLEPKKPTEIIDLSSSTTDTDSATNQDDIEEIILLDESDVSK